MTADALAPYVARTSAAMVLAEHGRWASGFHEEGFELRVPFLWMDDMKYKYIFVFLKLSARNGSIITDMPDVTLVNYHVMVMLYNCSYEQVSIHMDCLQE